MSRFSKEIVLVLGVGAAALITVTAWHRYNKRKNEIPEKWVEIGSVHDLWIYPLKSGAAIELGEVECTESGPTFFQKNKLPLRDRYLLVYNEKDGEQRTARNYSKMILIVITAVSEHEIQLDAPDMSPLVINTSIKNPKLVVCHLWGGEPQLCIDCGDEAAKWISQYCINKDSSLRIGLDANMKRSITLDPWKGMTLVYPKLRSEDLGIFSDMCTYMICNQASTEDLNEKLPIDLSSLYFRPNITVVGPEAFTEDGWDWIKIGDDVIFRTLKPCTRCIMVNIDPETGVPVPEQAVLKKLQEYRQLTNKKKRQIEGSSPALGLYVGIRKTGIIKAGDKVYVG